MKKIQGNHDRIIPYRPQLKVFFGSTNAAVLYAQLEYWFGKNGGDSFYKFNAPCDNERYKKGDSLTEELGFSHDEVESALKRICRSFKSKKDFDACEDKFDSMPMCSYYDRISHTKFYFRNNEVCDYINSKDMDDLPVFADGRSQSLESVSSVLTENGISVFGDGNIACSILYLYKRLQQKITLENDSFVSIAQSDTDACTNNKHNNESVLPSPQAPTTGNARKTNTLASAPYACITNTDNEPKLKKSELDAQKRKETEKRIKGFKSDFESVFDAFLGTKGQCDDHFNKFFNKLKTSKNIEKDLSEFVIGSTNYTMQCVKMSTEYKYIKHFKNFIHDMAWREYLQNTTQEIEVKKSMPNFTPEQLTP